MTNETKVGDILYSSWGYSMTIVDFYQVVRLTPKMVGVKPLTKKLTEGSYQNGHCLPDKMVIEVPESLLTAKEGCYTGTVRNANGTQCPRSYLSKWEGQPVYFNHMD